MVYRGGQKLAKQSIAAPPKPLTRVMARSRQGRGLGDNADAYRMEVNEYVSRPDAKDKFDVFPCVTVRDMKTFVANRKQRRVWIPVTLCHDLLEHLKTCRTNNGTEDSRTSSLEESEGSLGGTKLTSGYDVTKLEPKEFDCPKTGRKVVTEIVDDSTRLRSYMDVRYSDRNDPEAFVEIIELRDALMGRLIKFLSDVATRYQPLDKECSIPSLYSYSGERRFYYDLRETRWGLRLQISQVTDLHRNVIGIPLETVVQFRDRLNQFISTLHLDESEDSSGSASKTIPRRRSLSHRRAVRKNKKFNKEGRRGNSNPEKGKRQQSRAENNVVGQTKEQIKAGVAGSDMARRQTIDKGDTKPKEVCNVAHADGAIPPSVEE